MVHKYKIITQSGQHEKTLFSKITNKWDKNYSLNITTTYARGSEMASIKNAS